MWRGNFGNEIIKQYIVHEKDNFLGNSRHILGYGKLGYEKAIRPKWAGQNTVFPILYHKKKKGKKKKWRGRGRGGGLCCKQQGSLCKAPSFYLETSLPIRKRVSDLLLIMQNYPKMDI